VEGLVVEAAAELEGEGEPEVEHQAVLQVGADPVVLLLVVPAGLVVQVDRQQVLRHQTDRRLAPADLVRVLVLALWEDPVEAGFSGLPLVGTAREVIATVDQTLLAEMVPLIGRRTLLGRIRKNDVWVVVALPSWDTLVGWGEGYWFVMATGLVQGSSPLVQRFPQVPPPRSLPWSFVVVVDTV
jgi:hypothetical protein